MSVPRGSRRHIHKKLKKYVDRDDFSRLKSYISKHGDDVSLEEPVYEGGDSLLHIACKKGQDHTVWYLLKKGADPLLQNDTGQTPLHCAFVFALTESHYAFYDLVKPLMEKCPRAMAMVDRWGRTPCDLLKQIRCLLSEKGATVQEEMSSSSSESEGDDWTARMHWEADAEYTESLGAYEQDFTDDRDELGTAANTSGRESYDRWSARMAEEMSRKHQHKYERSHPEDAKRSKQDQESKAREQAEFQRKLEREHQEYQNRATANRRQKLTEAKGKYEKRCAEVFWDDNECKETLGYGDVPWPTPSNWDKGTESLKEFLLCDINVNDVKNVKKYLRGQQVKWHPDRFQQKCGERIKAGEGDRIMDKVKLISQLLNNIIAEMDEG